MSCEISWERFLECADAIETKSETLGDDWKVVGDRSIPAGAYLRRVSLSRPENGGLQKWEHHVLYSLSYSGPVMYFDVCDEKGTPPPLDRVWDVCHSEYKPDSKEEMLSVISQQEHPVLLRPFFMVHPCKTWEFLSDTSEKMNVLVKFITSVGPVVNLSINYSYGKI